MAKLRLPMRTAMSENSMNARVPRLMSLNGMTVYSVPLREGTRKSGAVRQSRAQKRGEGGGERGRGGVAIQRSLTNR